MGSHGLGGKGELDARGLVTAALRRLLVAASLERNREMAVPMSTRMKRAEAEAIVLCCFDRSSSSVTA